MINGWELGVPSPSNNKRLHTLFLETRKPSSSSSADHVFFSIAQDLWKTDLNTKNGQTKCIFQFFFNENISQKGFWNLVIFSTVSFCW